jgi:hypothetical protein
MYEYPQLLHATLPDNHSDLSSCSAHISHLEYLSESEKNRVKVWKTELCSLPYS